MRPLLERALALRNIKSCKEALEQLPQIYEYVRDSIEFGEYGDIRQVTIDDVEQGLEDLI